MCDMCKKCASDKGTDITDCEQCCENYCGGLDIDDEIEFKQLLDELCRDYNGGD